MNNIVYCQNYIILLITYCTSFESVFSQYKSIIQHSPAELLPINENRMEDELLNWTKTHLIRYKFQYITAASFFENGTVATWFNVQALHSAPLSLNLMHNAIAKSLIGSSSSIHVKNAPFKYFPEAQSTNAVLRKYGFTLSIFICIAIGIYSPAFFAFYIQVKLNEQNLIYFSSHLIQISYE